MKIIHVGKIKKGGMRESNSRPSAPKAEIIPLDQCPSMSFLENGIIYNTIIHAETIYLFDSWVPVYLCCHDKGFIVFVIFFTCAVWFWLLLFGGDGRRPLQGNSFQLNWLMYILSTNILIKWWRSNKIINYFKWFNNALSSIHWSISNKYVIDNIK